LYYNKTFSKTSIHIYAIVLRSFTALSRINNDVSNIFTIFNIAYVALLTLKSS